MRSIEKIFCRLQGNVSKYDLAASITEGSKIAVPVVQYRPEYSSVANPRQYSGSIIVNLAETKRGRPKIPRDHSSTRRGNRRWEQEQR